MLHETLSMPPHPTSVRRGRDAMAAWLPRSEGTYSSEAALLLTGELLTYALMRARRDVTLSVTEQRGRLHVEVQVDAPGRGPALVVDPGGRERGLPGVRSIAASWGTHTVLDAYGLPSDVAWFELVAGVLPVRLTAVSDRTGTSSARGRAPS